MPDDFSGNFGKFHVLNRASGGCSTGTGRKCRQEALIALDVIDLSEKEKLFFYKSVL